VASFSVSNENSDWVLSPLASFYKHQTASSFSDFENYDQVVEQVKLIKEHLKKGSIYLQAFKKESDSEPLKEDMVEEYLIDSVELLEDPFEGESLQTLDTHREHKDFAKALGLPLIVESNKPKQAQPIPFSNTSPDLEKNTKTLLEISQDLEKKTRTKAHHSRIFLFCIVGFISLALLGVFYAYKTHLLQVSQKLTEDELKKLDQMVDISQENQNVEDKELSLQTTKNIDPDKRKRAIVFYKEGNKLYAQKKYADALKQYQYSIDTDPLFPYSYRSMGVVYSILNKSQFAKKAYQKYLGLNPQAYDRQEVERLLVQLNNK